MSSSSIPAGMVPLTQEASDAPKIPFVKLAHGRAMKGDFIKGKILSASEHAVKNDQGFDKIEMNYVIEIEDFKLSDTEKLDGSIVAQDIKKGSQYILSTTKNMRFKGIYRPLMESVWPRGVHLVYDGKEMFDGKKFNNFKVYADPQVAATPKTDNPF